jgi:hypothetical protein
MQAAPRSITSGLDGGVHEDLHLGREREGAVARHDARREHIGGDFAVAEGVVVLEQHRIHRAPLPDNGGMAIAGIGTSVAMSAAAASPCGVICRCSASSMVVSAGQVS